MDQPLQSLFAAATGGLDRLLDAVLPPRCFGCGALVDRQGSFCAPCWGELRFIAEPLCRCCGLPLEPPARAGLTCAPCLANPPAFASARAVWLHQAAARDTVLAFKYADKPQLARALARHLTRVAAPVLENPDAILMPVPLHRWRLLSRRYNQAAELARALGRLARRAVIADGLIRIRATQPQQGLTRSQRQDNVRRAFSLNPRARARVAGRAVVLVDDVLTTGATVDACARVLLAAGAVRVDVITLTRVANAER